MSDTLKCAWCDKEFTPKRSTAKFCSPACKLKSARKNNIDKQLTDKGLPPTIQASRLPQPPPKKEADFEPLPVQTYTDNGNPTPGSPEWYIHGTFENPDQTWDKVCVRCGEPFTTTLELMRFCSQLCKSEVWVVIAEGPHKNYLKWRAS